MLLKAKSTRIVLIMSMLALTVFLGLGIYLNKQTETRFEGEGYILSMEPSLGEDTVQVDQLWISGGNAWEKTMARNVNFRDVQGEKKEVKEGSFVHYTDGSVLAFKDSVISDMDQYQGGYIYNYFIKGGRKIQRNTEGEYLVPYGKEEETLTNFVWKTQNLQYLFVSPEITILMPTGERQTTTAGFLEMVYTDGKRNAVLLSDGTSNWQMLTDGTALILANGVVIDLDSADLYTGADQNAYLNLFRDLTPEDEENVNSESKNRIPSYQFHVVNGQDGTAGTDGEGGLTGEDGKAGEDGAAGEQGAMGDTPSDTPSTGKTGVSGYDGDNKENQSASTTIKDKIPVVNVLDWSLNGTGLKTTLYMEDQYCSNIEMETTRVSIIDVDTGEEIYYWTSAGDSAGNGEMIDFFLESKDGYTLHCNELKLNKNYRFVVKAGYLLNGLVGETVFLDRGFTTDNYGVVCELVGRTEDTLTVQVSSNNPQVSIMGADPGGNNGNVQLTVSGSGLNPEDVVGTNELVAGKEFMIRMGGQNGGNVFLSELINFSNRYYDVTYQIPIRIAKTDDSGNVTYDYATVRYTYTYQTLKKAPVVGGIRLTAYNEGYFAAELTGLYNNARSLKNESGEGYYYYYNPVEDTDDAITKTTFLLYEYVPGGEPKLVGKQVAENSYAAFFTSQEIDSFEDTKVYFVTASYEFFDGEKTVSMNAVETYYDEDKTQDRENYKDDLISEAELIHEKGKLAWSSARLAYILNSSLSFEGKPGVLNHKKDTTAGTLFNAIRGTIYIESTRNIVWSKDRPIELVISGAPDYYMTKYFNSADLNPSTSNYELKWDSTDINRYESYPVGGTAHKLAIDLDANGTRLDGLKANSPYNFSVYAYIEEIKVDELGNQTKEYVRTSLGTTVIRTDEEMNLQLAMYQNPSFKNENGPAYLGFDFALGASSWDAARTLETPLYSSDPSDSYQMAIANAYKSMKAITFRLYKENLDGTLSLAGECTIPNKVDYENSPYYAVIDHSELYDTFYGANAHRFAADHSGYLAMVGVGEKFVYRFIKPGTAENPVYLSPMDLVTANYYISADYAFDYTYTRAYLEYDKVDYYSFDYAKENYVNALTINGNTTAQIREKMDLENVNAGMDRLDVSIRKEVVATPYPYPSTIKNSEGGYIDTRILTNQEMNRYDLTEDVHTTYDKEINGTTGVGIELSSRYENDDAGYTKYFIYYGYEWEDYTQASDSQDITDQTADLANQTFDFYFKIPLEGGSNVTDRSIPKVKLLTYQPEDLVEDPNNAGQVITRKELMRLYVSDPRLLRSRFGDNTFLYQAGVGARAELDDKGFDYVLYLGEERTYVLYVPEEGEEYTLLAENEGEAPTTIKKFSLGRGHSYIFAFEAQIEGYAWQYEITSEVVKDENGRTARFVYPYAYYMSRLSESEINGEFETKKDAYTQEYLRNHPDKTEEDAHMALAMELANAKAHTLTSAKVTLKRQKPVVYAKLKDTLTFDSKVGEGDSAAGSDIWQVYLSDPDNALRKESIMANGDTNCYFRTEGDFPFSGFSLHTSSVTYGLLTGKTGTEDGTAGGTKKYLTISAVASKTDTEAGIVKDQKYQISTKDSYYDGTSAGTNLVPNPEKETALTAIFGEMGKTSLDENGKVLQTGGEIRIDNLSNKGLWYRLTGAYCLDEDVPDSDPGKYQAITFFEHSYIGAWDYSKYATDLPQGAAEHDPLEVNQQMLDDHSTIRAFLGATKSWLTLAEGAANDAKDQEQDESQKDAVYRQTKMDYLIQNYYNTKEYKDIISHIAGIKVTAMVQVQGSSDWKWIYAYDSEGNLLDGGVDQNGSRKEEKVKELWLELGKINSAANEGDDPDGFSSEYRYRVMFSINAFDEDSITYNKEAQYGVGDQIQFIYTIYYTDGNGTGQTLVPGELSQEYYAVKYAGGDFRYLQDSTAFNQVNVTASPMALYSMVKLKAEDQTTTANVNYGWAHTLTAMSDIYCKNTNNMAALALNSSMEGRNYNYQVSLTTQASMNEILHLSGVEVKPDPVTVLSAVPIMERTAVSSGIAMVTASAYIRNYNLLPYNGSEMETSANGSDSWPRVRAYILIYDMEDVQGTTNPSGPTTGIPRIVGAAVTSSLRDPSVNGWIRLNWKIGPDKNYKAAIFYKKDERIKDQDLLGTIRDTDLEADYAYMTSGTLGDREKAEAIINMLTNSANADVFAPVALDGSSEGASLSFKTSTYLSLTAGQLSLNYTNDYLNKELTFRASVHDDINSVEEQKLSLFYTLERKPSGTPDTEYKVILSDADNPDNDAFTWEEGMNPYLLITAPEFYEKGVHYYQKSGDSYIPISVGDYKIGENIPADTYYQRSYEQMRVGDQLISGKTYHKKLIMGGEETYIPALSGDYVVGKPVKDSKIPTGSEWYVKAVGTYNESDVYYEINAQTKLVLLKKGDYLAGGRVSEDGIFRDNQENPENKDPVTVGTAFEEGVNYYKKVVADGDESYVLLVQGDYVPGDQVGDKTVLKYDHAADPTILFREGDVYYLADKDSYTTKAEKGDYTLGQTIQEGDAFYAETYTLLSGGRFLSGQSYYKKAGDTYELAVPGTVAYGSPITINGTIYKGSPECYWSWYESSDSAYTDFVKTPFKDNGELNSISLHYLPGGKIVPGYEYRMQVRIYFLTDIDGDGIEEYVLATEKLDASSQDNTYANRVKYSANTENWNRIDYTNPVILTSMLSTIQNPNREFDYDGQGNVTATKHSLSVYFTFHDKTYTSPTNTYYIRLVEYDSQGNATILEGPEHYDKYENGNYSINYEYRYNEAYHLIFKNLKPSTKYGLQVYSLMDPDYNNYINLYAAETGALTSEENGLADGEKLPVVDLSPYYPRSGSAYQNTALRNLREGNLVNFNNLFVNYLNITESEKYKSLPAKAEEIRVIQAASVQTLNDRQSFEVGTYAKFFTREKASSLPTEKKGNLTLYFVGSYNCDGPACPVTKCEWALYDNTGGSLQGLSTYGSFDAPKTGMFTYDEKTGRTAFTIPDLHFSYPGANETTVTLGLYELDGLYQLELRFLTADGEEQTVSIQINLTRES